MEIVFINNNKRKEEKSSSARRLRFHCLERVRIDFKPITNASEIGHFFIRFWYRRRCRANFDNTDIRRREQGFARVFGQSTYLSFCCIWFPLLRSDIINLVLFPRHICISRRSNEWSRCSVESTRGSNFVGTGVDLLPLRLRSCLRCFRNEETEFVKEDRKRFAFSSKSELEFLATLPLIFLSICLHGRPNSVYQLRSNRV
mmetsp:Transcript_4354/g.14233  ORF Transcript_4354/g.14233 Transcript_4354/m.14233 type:complete len:201 (+) Transcript_4354:393-995(+)